jgi:hypothetical protein
MQHNGNNECTGTGTSWQYYGTMVLHQGYYQGSAIPLSVTSTVTGSWSYCKTTCAYRHTWFSVHIGTSQWYMDLVHVPVPMVVL